MKRAVKLCIFCKHHHRLCNLLGGRVRHFSCQVGPTDIWTANGTDKHMA